MSYEVLAQKWRPQNFSDVVGQEHITTTLKNQILSECAYRACIPFLGTPRHR